LIDKQKIDEASHILLVTNSNSFANASALYTYILTLHKKVSLYNKEKLATNLSFLPWYEKCRAKAPSSADYAIEVNENTKELFDFFQKEEVTINVKMATSLYAGLFKRYSAFLSRECDGTIFALISELISLGAEHHKCNDFLRKHESLALFRLKSLMFKNMLLQDDARVAVFEFNETVLKSSGASISDAYKVMKEALCIVNVEEAHLVKRDENMKILKIIKDK